MLLPKLPATLEAVEEIAQWIVARLDQRGEGDRQAAPSVNP